MSEEEIRVLPIDDPSLGLDAEQLAFCREEGIETYGELIDAYALVAGSVAEALMAADRVCAREARRARLRWGLN